MSRRRHVEYQTLRVSCILFPSGFHSFVKWWVRLEIIIFETTKILSSSPVQTPVSNTCQPCRTCMRTERGVLGSLTFINKLQTHETISCPSSRVVCRLLFSGRGVRFFTRSIFGLVVSGDRFRKQCRRLKNDVLDGRFSSVPYHAAVKTVARGVHDFVLKYFFIRKKSLKFIYFCAYNLFIYIQ